MKKKILLVDDNAHFRSLIAEILKTKDENFSVSLADNGISALKLLEIEQFDFLITDINIPNLDGIELFHKVKALYPQLPVILLCGLVHSVLSEQLLSEGAFLVFNNAFDLTLMKRVIKYALKSKQPQSKSDQYKVTTCRQ